MSVCAYFQPAIDGDLVMELGTLNGSSSSTGTVSVGSGGTYFGDPTGVSGATPNPKVVSVLNLFAGGTLTNSSGSGVNAGWVTGQTFVLNAYGGILQNTRPRHLHRPESWRWFHRLQRGEPGQRCQRKCRQDDHRLYPRLAESDASPTATTVGSTSAFVNFNGGELEYNNPSGTQGTFINPGVTGGVFVFKNGAIIGSNGGTATIPHPLLAHPAAA